MAETWTPGSCPDCGVSPGGQHEDGCDVARCLFTGRQRLQCDGYLPHALQDVPHIGQPSPGCLVPVDCGRDIWTGLWPGEAECREYGWYSWFRAPEPGETYGEWVRCDPDHPEAGPDLNRLVLECTWDRGARRWVRRG